MLRRDGELRRERRHRNQFQEQLALASSVRQDVPLPQVNQRALGRVQAPLWRPGGHRSNKFAHFLLAHVVQVVAFGCIAFVQRPSLLRRSRGCLPLKTPAVQLIAYPALAASTKPRLFAAENGHRPIL